jgi:hypothetical protein
MIDLLDMGQLPTGVVFLELGMCLCVAALICICVTLYFYNRAFSMSEPEWEAFEHNLKAAPWDDEWEPTAPGFYSRVKELA